MDYKTLAICIIQVIAILSYAGASADEMEPSFDKADWISAESTSLIIYFRPETDLKALQRKLNSKAFFSGQITAYSEVDPQKAICDRMDSVFNEVKNILGVHPAMPKVKIKIFKDTDELNGAYFMLFGKKGDSKSFYVKKYNTIYTSENTMTDPVMAHEMAHAVIDHYLPAIPSEVVGEMMASYVGAYFDKSKD